jgi:hypothetical protein
MKRHAAPASLLGRSLALALVLVLRAPAVLAGQDVALGPSGGELGTVRFPTSCDGAVQPEFERAVALLHHMTYAQAREGFTRVAERDADCAMAHWGIAMTLFQPLWPNRPTPAALERGRAELRAARDLGTADSRERGFIAAAGAFFDDPEADYWTRIQRWEAASRELHDALDDDLEADAFFALALLATAPATGGATENHRRAAEILAAIHARSPTHPGAIHYTIHANDVNGREHESLDLVRSYGRIAPRNPHALHMPTHIFVRLGSWREVIDWNRRAEAAALENPAGDGGKLVSDEFPHAGEYLVYAYLQRGDDGAARGERDRLAAEPHLEPTFKTAFHRASIPARYALERGAWTEAAALEPRPGDDLDWDRFPWPEAITWFARGLGSAHIGDAESARAAVTRLIELRDAARAAGEEAFAREIEILRLGAAGWLEQAAGDGDAAVRLLREAVDLQSSTPKSPVTPAPTVPSLELLADALAEQGRPAEALEAYESSLRLAPGRFNALLGAARAAVATDDGDGARRHYAALLENASEDSDRAGVAEARRYLAGSSRP